MNNEKKSYMKEHELQIDCYTSLGCYLYTIGFCIYILIINLTNNTGITVGRLFAILVFLVMPIYGLALMIKIRTKHPESKFGKILMIMYIALAIVPTIFAFIVLFTIARILLGIG